MGDVSKVPYAEPNAWQGFKSPYSTESHLKFRATVRRLLDGLMSEARQYEDTGERPSDAFVQKLGAYGLLAVNLGPGPWLASFVLLGGIQPAE
ncbi:hypothetical protein G6F46_012559 [Rhizopus delemar]|uniref:Uncharacterized protein n=2 Tax=Rhizopus TaxID=4842 RepID=A0A9P6Z5V8_9FUNG|nr:hypothetical protein G6F36_014023 [Rhizopus arrhizus]KAG1450238.1 hypothetical protein G6F55_009778 [Rhizopus delemar]KAG1497608.1 hypothetical protein G6F53_011935 [Rhizopus delemar]KAG1501661.1 hypothetical protein G6F54_002888 [Rhizopus delemar]KAG1510615.1 hypothetical protein G6F52_010856 [Rhizopus delemar]